MRILAFGAHPDDIEIGCGGTLRKYVEDGHEVFHGVLTSGEAGARDIPTAELALTREGEARHSAALLGAKEVIFFRFRDGLTQFTPEMKVEVINHIRRIRPDIVFTHASSDGFPDHRIAHELVKAALTGAAGPWYQDSSGEPHSVPHVFGFEVWEPMNRHQIAVDISAQIGRKLEALACHGSQTGKVSYADAVQGLARFRGVMSFTGTHAEVFEALRTELP